jgi:hypothetical protein
MYIPVVKTNNISTSPFGPIVIIVNGGMARVIRNNIQTFDSSLFFFTVFGGSGYKY